MVSALVSPGSASGKSTLRTICTGEAPIACAASTRPPGTSFSMFSTMRAMKGAAERVSGTMAAVLPMETPTMARVKGIIHSARMR